VKRKNDERRPLPYRQPLIETFDAVKVVEAMGPVSAGSSANCGPMLGDFCL
jgi:hypothetical protein